jgi:hypothetical protein
MGSRDVYGIVSLRVMTQMYSPLRTVGSGSLQEELRSHQPKSCLQSAFTIELQRLPQMSER